jgi:hypothetical protein
VDAAAHREVALLLGQPLVAVGGLVELDERLLRCCVRGGRVSQRAKGREGARGAKQRACLNGCAKTDCARGLRSLLATSLRRCCSAWRAARGVPGAVSPAAKQHARGRGPPAPQCAACSRAARRCSTRLALQLQEARHSGRLGRFAVGAHLAGQLAILAGVAGLLIGAAHGRRRVDGGVRHSRRRVGEGEQGRARRRAVRRKRLACGRLRRRAVLRRGGLALLLQVRLGHGGSTGAGGAAQSCRQPVKRRATTARLRRQAARWRDPPGAATSAVHHRPPRSAARAAGVSARAQRRRRRRSRQAPLSPHSSHKKA